MSKENLTLRSRVSCTNVTALSRDARQLDVTFHFEFLWPIPYKLCSMVGFVRKIYLSKLHGYAQNTIAGVNATSWTQDMFNNIATKLFWVRKWR